MAFMHEDAEGWSAFSTSRGDIFLAQLLMPQHYLSFSTELVHCTWVCLPCSLCFFGRILSGHAGPRETTAVPSCHCAPGRAGWMPAISLPRLWVHYFQTARITGAESCSSTAQELLSYGQTDPTAASSTWYQHLLHLCYNSHCSKMGK